MDIQFLLWWGLRFLHIVAAVAAVGGSIFMRIALAPAAAAALTDDVHQRLREEVRRRWSKVVMAAIGFLLLSGLINLIRLEQTEIKALTTKTLYHALFGVKFLAALGVFFVASALVGRSEALAAIRANAKRWLTINLVLALIVLGTSSALRLLRDRQHASLSSPTLPADAE